MSVQPLRKNGDTHKVNSRFSRMARYNKMARYMWEQKDDGGHADTFYHNIVTNN